MDDLTKNEYFNKLFNCKEINFLEKGEGNFDIKIRSSYPDGKEIFYWAANPPNYNTSFSGSGLPFPNPEIAFDKTPNIGKTRVTGGTICFYVYFPSSFYTDDNNTFIPPTIYYKASDSRETKIINLKNAIPYRTLTDPIAPLRCKNSPLFYQNDNLLKIKDVRSQEKILIESGYPSKNIMPQNFWGNSIPR